MGKIPGIINSSLRNSEQVEKKFASRNLTFSQISAPKVWHAHPYVQFYTMVAKISQNNGKDPCIIWSQMLFIRKCSMNLCVGLGNLVKSEIFVRRHPLSSILDKF